MRGSDLQQAARLADRLTDAGFAPGVPGERAMSQAVGQRAGDPARGGWPAGRGKTTCACWPGCVHAVQPVRILDTCPAWAILASGQFTASFAAHLGDLDQLEHDDGGLALRGQRAAAESPRAIVVNIGNALMCLVILALVAFYRH